MNLSKLSDQILLTETKKLAEKERETLISILHHLKEIERRRLFCDLKYPSLFAYAVGELKYSEDQAARRISAMRLLRDVPEIEEKIESGALTLSNLNLAQTLFKREKQEGNPVTKEAKMDVLLNLENKSAREARAFVAEINPGLKSTRKFDFNLIEDGELRAKLLKVKGLFAAVDPSMSLEDVLHRLCDQELAKRTKEPARSVGQKNVRQSMNSGVSSDIDQVAVLVERTDDIGQPAVLVDDADDAVVPALARVNDTKVLSKAETRRQVWRRDQGKCTNCGSNYALEIDHILPRAAGGLWTIENLRLLCRSCNQKAAIEHFGQLKMDGYLGAH
jgi:hypothetical protein